MDGLQQDVFIVSSKSYNGQGSKRFNPPRVVFPHYDKTATETTDGCLYDGVVVLFAYSWMRTGSKLVVWPASQFLVVSEHTVRQQLINVPSGK